VLAARQINAVIPPNPTRKHPHRYDKTAYKGRNVIERMFCRLKDFRRIATRYDKRADIFLSTILLAATLTWFATRYDKRADIFLSTILLAATLTWWIN